LVNVDFILRGGYTYPPQHLPVKSFVLLLEKLKKKCVKIYRPEYRQKNGSPILFYTRIFFLPLLGVPIKVRKNAGFIKNTFGFI
jgi:hypothetical protein